MTQELFLEVTEWQDKTFPLSSAYSKVCHLESEVQDLKQELNSIVHTENRKSEFADCFILLFGAACADGMSYEDIIFCIEAKLEVNKERKWGKPDENGVVNNIQTP